MTLTVRITTPSDGPFCVTSVDAVNASSGRWPKLVNDQVPCSQARGGHSLATGIVVLERLLEQFR